MRLLFFLALVLSGNSFAHVNPFIATGEAAKTQRECEKEAERLFTPRKALAPGLPEGVIAEFPSSFGTALAFSPDGKRIFAGSPSSAQIVEVATGRVLANTKLETEGSVPTVRFSPQGTEVAVAAEEQIYFLNPSNGKEIRKSAPTGFVIPPPPQNRLEHKTPNYSSDGSHLSFLVRGADSFVRVWDLKGKKEFTFPAEGNKHFLESFFFPGTTDIGTMDTSGQLWKWKSPYTESTKTAVRIPTRFGSPTFLPNGSLAYVDYEASAVHLLDVETGRKVRTIPIGSYRKFRFSSDRRSLLYSEEGEVRIIDIESGIETSIHVGEIRDFELSPDGRTLATTQLDSQEVRLWDLNAALPELGDVETEELWRSLGKEDRSSVRAVALLRCRPEILARFMTNYLNKKAGPPLPEAVAKVYETVYDGKSPAELINLVKSSSKESQPKLLTEIANAFVSDLDHEGFERRERASAILPEFQSSLPASLAEPFRAALLDRYGANYTTAEARGRLSALYPAFEAQYPASSSALALRLRRAREIIGR